MKLQPISTPFQTLYSHTCIIFYTIRYSHQDYLTYPAFCPGLLHNGPDSILNSELQAKYGGGWENLEWNLDE